MSNDDGKQINALQIEKEQLTEDLKAETDKNKLLQAQLHTLRCKLNEKEEENVVLNELYLSANRIKSFMASIRKYGAMFDQVKKKHFNLTKCVGMEDVDTFKIRMNDLYDDIAHIEQSYHCLYESIDIIKTESRGKELELLTKNKAKIEWLEKENNAQSQHLDEYVKTNQKLQTELTDREMQLRQSYNSFNFIKQKLIRCQKENNNLYDCINGVNNGNNGIQFTNPFVTDQYML